MGAVYALFAAVLLAVATPAVAAEEGAVKQYTLPGQGRLQMWVPGKWLDEVEQPHTEPPTIRFRAAEGEPFLVLMTPIWMPGPEVQVPDEESLRDRVERSADWLRDKAAEDEIRVLKFSGATGAGFYFSMTDRAPKPGEFKFLTQGMLRVSDLIVAFTILNGGSKSTLVPDALKMLKSAQHVP